MTSLVGTGPVTIPQAQLAEPPLATFAEEDADGDLEARAGQVIAGRYTLLSPLGSGASGEVWSAEDRVLRDRVALKWLRRITGPRQARVRREITTLRLLQVPGVVRLLDEGIEGDRPFLVMERVDGSPFPGRRDARVEWGEAPRWTWAEIAAPSLALLEVLARVHAAGVVHRDLKPDNVLVSAEGRPTVLDFGISLWQSSSDRLTQAGQILGTPRYLAPEQLLGQAVDGRTDLYAVGVMLYRTLAGVSPHEAPDVPSMLRARLTTAARPVAQLVPDLPPEVARGIDRMLALRIDDRPRSAAEALAAFRGLASDVTSGSSLPRLGGDDPVRAVLEAALAGRAVDVIGAPGTGRSRCLADVAEALAQAGKRVVRVGPSRAPFGSLRPIAGTPPEHATLGVADLSAWMRDRIQRMITEGAVIVADDAEQLDRWSAAVLARCSPGPGAIVRARLAREAGDRDVVRLSPLDEAALQPLFAGPDRLFHLREDAARALWERTEGLPIRVDAEITLWVRLGLARRDGARIVVERDALNRLQAGLPGAAASGSAGFGWRGEAHQEELLRWLSLAGRHLPIRDLARVVDQPMWALEADCEAFVEQGVARRLPGGRVEPRGHVEVPWPEARTIEAHRAIAAELAPGQEGRLFHLLAADDALAAAREALVVARRAAAERGLGEAIAALSEGLRALSAATGPQAAPNPGAMVPIATPDPGAMGPHAAPSLGATGPQAAGQAVRDEELCLLTEWTKMAFAQGTPGALDAVLYELSRCRASGPEVDRLVALVRAVLGAPGAGGLLAMEAADDLPPFADPGLERRRQRARIIAAAARVNPSLLDAVLDEVAAWAERTGDPMARLCLAEGQALLRYQQGRFEEAAALNAEAAALDPWLTGRIAATLNGASAMLEAFRHREAEARADEARGLASYCRQPYWEARAEWLVRSARYRMGEAREVDHDLCAAVARVGTPDLEALVCLTEAAVAMRAGLSSGAAGLADRAARIWREMDRRWGGLLARSVAVGCGSPADPGEIDEMAGRALACKLPGVGAQVLALMARTVPVRAGWRESIPTLITGVPESAWSLRMDVLSMNEALSALDGATR